jgi:hypothetical protein
LFLSNAELLDATHSIQSSVSAASTTIVDKVTQHLLKHNTAKEGFICWLNSSSKRCTTRIIAPEPINFKEALTYLILHDQYDATGYDIYEIFHLSEEQQYERIMQLLQKTSMLSKNQTITTVEKADCTLQLDIYKQLKKAFYPDGVDSTINCS